jgi:hypothetical protein
MKCVAVVVHLLRFPSVRSIGNSVLLPETGINDARVIIITSDRITLHCIYVGRPVIQQVFFTRGRCGCLASRTPLPFPSIRQVFNVNASERADLKTVDRLGGRSRDCVSLCSRHAALSYSDKHVFITNDEVIDCVRDYLPARCRSARQRL